MKMKTYIKNDPAAYWSLEGEFRFNDPGRHS
jgi:hypothetical protein